LRLLRLCRTDGTNEKHAEQQRVQAAPASLPKIAICAAVRLR
jgi:hypothetical protein